MRSVGFLLTPAFQMLDLAGPCAAFESVSAAMGGPGYELVMLSGDGAPVRNSLGMEFATQKIGDAAIHTLVAVGSAPSTTPPDATLRSLAAIAPSCERLASVCTGAFVLAAAGLLNGRRATTHWRHAAELQGRFPAIRVEPDRIYCRDGNVWTSAGITAGIDLALALIEQDHGPTMAGQVARHLVAYRRRLGGQSQFAAAEDLPVGKGRVAHALAFARENIAGALAVEDLAQACGMSPRNFSRLFRQETGTTPAKAIERLRADLARGHVETGDAPIEAIARQVGFGDAERMRRAFVRLYGMPPQSLRRKARS